MKITEITDGALITSGGNSVQVGTAGAESFLMHGAPEDDATPRHDERPPQVGYGLRIGRHVIPTPGYNSGDTGGVVGSMVRS